MKLCSIEGCFIKHKGHGYCDKHYQRFKRHGDAQVRFKKKACSISDCLNKYYAKGFCDKHYQRIKYHDDPNYLQRSKFKNVVEAYLSRVIKSSDDKCWDWNSNKNIHDFGYAVIPFKKERLKAHRFSYEYYIGPIPKGKFVCHKCDNPRCTNPKHLFLGTNLENIQDCIDKGRHPFLKINRSRK